MASDRLCRDRKENIVILDTNALMMLFEFSIDLESELDRILGSYKFIIPSTVSDELRLLSEQGKGRQKRIAKSAISLSKKYETVQFETNESVDDSILLLAKKTEGIVITNDKELRKRLKNNGIKAIYLRAKKKLEMD